MIVLSGKVPEKDARTCRCGKVYDMRKYLAVNCSCGAHHLANLGRTIRIEYLPNLEPSGPSASAESLGADEQLQGNE